MFIKKHVEYMARRARMGHLYFPSEMDMRIFAAEVASVIGGNMGKWVHRFRSKKPRQTNEKKHIGVKEDFSALQMDGCEVI